VRIYNITCFLTKAIGKPATVFFKAKNSIGDCSKGIDFYFTIARQTVPCDEWF